MRIEITKEEFIKLVEEALREEMAYQGLDSVGMGSLAVVLDCSWLSMSKTLDWIARKANVSEEFYQDIKDQMSVIDITNKWYDRISKIVG